MKKNTQMGYLAPEIEVFEMSVEQGFAGSTEDPADNMEEIGPENDPIVW